VSSWQVKLRKSLNLNDMRQQSRDQLHVTLPRKSHELISKVPDDCELDQDSVAFCSSFKTNPSLGRQQLQEKITIVGKKSLIGLYAASGSRMDGRNCSSLDDQSGFG
jgi:hypothetical protein